jgi:hypothetical protein
VALTWSGGSDAGSGIQTYGLYYSASGYPTAATGTKIYEGTALSFIHQGLPNGKTCYYRLYAVDEVGNVSSGARPWPHPKLGPCRGWNCCWAIETRWQEESIFPQEILNGRGRGITPPPLFISFPKILGHPLSYCQRPTFSICCPSRFRN